MKKSIAIATIALLISLAAVLYQLNEARKQQIITARIAAGRMGVQCALAAMVQMETLWQGEDNEQAEKDWILDRAAIDLLSRNAETCVYYNILGSDQPHSRTERRATGLQAGYENQRFTCNQCNWKHPQKRASGHHQGGKDLLAANRHPNGPTPQGGPKR